MNYDGDKEMITTSFGGFITLSFYIMFIIHILVNSFAVLNLTNLTFVSYDVITNHETFVDHTMQDFKDTFSMFVGTTNTDIDLWDNPYIYP